MRILYCNPSFWDYRIPFYAYLKQLFHGEFYVTYSTKRYSEGRETLLSKIEEALGTNAIPLKNEIMFDWRRLSFKSIWKGIPIPVGLFSIIKKVSPDILITEGFYQWTPIVLLYSILFRKVVFIGYERTPWTERNTKWWKTLHRKLTDKFVRGYLVNGSETKKYLMSIGVKEEKIHIGGMSADSSGLRKGIASMSNTEKQLFRRQFEDKKGIIFLFSGRLSKLKGADLLLIAWESHVKKYPNDHLIMIGYGDLSETLGEKYKNIESVHLMGQVVYDNVYKYYAIADVFILPTLTDNWSLVIPEAMSCGLPVATSIYNGCYPELVKKDVNGFVFDTYKQETIIEALDYFHHVDLKLFGQHSVELEKNYNTENSAKRVYDAIMYFDHNKNAGLFK